MVLPLKNQNASQNAVSAKRENTRMKQKSAHREYMIFVVKCAQLKTSNSGKKVTLERKLKASPPKSSLALMKMVATLEVLSMIALS